MLPVRQVALQVGPCGVSNVMRTGRLSWFCTLTRITLNQLLDTGWLLAMRAVQTEAGVGEGVEVGVAVALAVGEEVAVGLAVAVAVAVGDVCGLAVAVAVGDAVGVGVAVTAGVGVAAAGANTTSVMRLASSWNSKLAASSGTRAT